MSQKLPIIIDLWPGSKFSLEDAIELEYNLMKIQRNRVNVGYEGRGGELQIGLEFIALTTAIGFFTKLGEDIYEFAKKKFGQILTRPFRKSRKLDNFYDLDIGYVTNYIKVNNITIYVFFVYQNLNDINRSIGDTEKCLRWIKARLKNKTFPKFSESEVKIYLNFHETSKGYKLDKNGKYTIYYYVKKRKRIFEKGKISDIEIHNRNKLKKSLIGKMRV